jgi:hypothetical protein
MKKTKLHTQFGRELIASLKEVLAHQRGEIPLPSRIVEPIATKRALKPDKRSAECARKTKSKKNKARKSA